MNEDDKLIAELKAKHGRVFTVTIPLDDEEDGKKATYYLKRPDEMTRKMIGKLADKDVKKAVIAGFNALRVAGDEVSVLENNFDAILSAQEALVHILEVQKATIKKN